MSPQFWFVLFTAIGVTILVTGYHTWRWYKGRVGHQMANLDRQ